MQGSDTDAAGRCDCKVGRVAARHDLGAVHENLESRWTSGEASVRDLADEFNRRVLRVAVEASGRTPLDGEVENLYRILTDDDIDAGSRTQARERLRQRGMAVEDVEDDFVSHQTVHRHLRECLDATRGPAHEDAVETGSFEVYVDVNVFCSDCGQLYTVEDLLDERTCDCHDHPTD